MKNSERDGNTRPPDLPLEKSVCRSGSNSSNWTWNNRQVPNRKRSTSRLYMSPCLFNLYAEYIMRNAGLEETQAGMKIAGRNINNLRYADDTTLMAESEEELKSLLTRVKEKSEKIGLKLNIQITKIMASDPISSVQFSCSVMSNSLQPHGLQHARPSCPSPTPGAYSNSCPSSR